MIQRRGSSQPSPSHLPMQMYEFPAVSPFDSPTPSDPFHSSAGAAADEAAPLPAGTDFLWPRRSSQASTYSSYLASLSLARNTADAPPLPVATATHGVVYVPQHRNSLSSFASSTGSPLPGSGGGHGGGPGTASTYSGGTTIGNLSSASIPLLRGERGRNDSLISRPDTAATHSSHGGGWDTWRRASLTVSDDASSDSHSGPAPDYSFPPQQPARKKFQARDARVDVWPVMGMGAWGERSPKSPIVFPSRKAGAFEDSEQWRTSLERWTFQRAVSPSSLSVPSRTPSLRSPSLSSPSLISYTLTSPATSLSSHASRGELSPGTGSLGPGGNPLAPLRKRLARWIGSGKRVGVEIQLLVELVEALENYVAEVGLNGEDEEEEDEEEESSMQSLVLGLMAPQTPLLLPQQVARSAKRRSMPPPPPIPVELVSEVTSLISELVEIAPDAQRCLTEGLYGPFAFPASLPSVQQLRTRPEMFDEKREGDGWWPRRLARDVRQLLWEIGAPIQEDAGGVGAVVELRLNGTVGATEKGERKILVVQQDLGSGADVDRDGEETRRPSRSSFISPSTTVSPRASLATAGTDPLLSPPLPPPTGIITGEEHFPLRKSLTGGQQRSASLVVPSLAAIGPTEARRASSGTATSGTTGLWHEAPPVPAVVLGDADGPATEGALKKSRSQDLLEEGRRRWAEYVKASGASGGLY